MAITKITYENKEAIQNDTSVANKSKVTDADMNEIKQVVNGNADELNTAKDDIEDLQSGQGTASADITSLKNRVSTLETDNTKNKSDINTLKSDNQTNKSNISTMQGQISEIQQEQKTQNTDIENLQINDTKQDSLISKLKNVALNTETEEAKSLYITDANKFGQLEVLGNQEQETRSGKNLFDKNNMNILQGYIDGSGSIIYNTSNKIAYIECPKNTDITVSGKYLRGIACYNQLPTYNLQTSVKNINQATYLTLNTGDNTYLAVWYYENNSGYTEQEITDTVQVEVGNVATEYEQYGASPSPNYPSKVVCLGSNKNLLNTSLMIETTKGGVTSKINSDGSITFNGTCTTNNNVFDFYIENTTKFTFDAIKDQTTLSAFYVSGSITDSNNSGAYFRVNDKSYAGGYINLVNLPQQKQLTRIYNSTSGSVFCDIRFNNGVVLDNFTIKCKAANTLEDALTYSPYGQGSTLISKINKNLAIAQNGIWYNYTNVSSDVQGYAYIARIKENSKITISKKNAGNRFVVFTSKEKIEVGAEMTQILVEQNTSRKEYTFNNVDGKWLFFGYYRGTDIEEAQLAGEEVQIEFEDTTTKYIEHQQEDYLLYIQQEMLQGDYFVKEIDGWKEVHSWDKPIVTGIESEWSFGITKTNTSKFILYKYNKIAYKPNSDSTSSSIILSNMFKAIQSANQQWINDNIEDITLNSGGNITFSVFNTFANTLDAFKTKIQSLYEEGTPLIVSFKLATPTKLACTSEQSAVLEELNNLDLFEGVNNIITAEDIALLKLKYALDVETYVDNKLNTINQQILEIAGGN